MNDAPPAPPPDPQMREDQADDAPARHPTLQHIRTVMQRVGVGLSVLLVIAAVWIVWEQRDDVAADITGFRFNGWMISTLVACVLANVVFTSLMFSLLTSRYGKCSIMEMQALTASSTLLNYLPLRPGMIGRIAYHKKFNQIGVRDTIMTIVQAVALSTIIGGYLGLAVVIDLKWDDTLAWMLIPPIPLMAIGGLLPSLRIWCWASLMRYLDILSWMVRSWLACKLLGIEIGMEIALALACVGAVVSLLPFTSNGLGPRELGIALIFSKLTPYSEGVAISTEALNRLFEIIVIAIVGTIGFAMLGHSHWMRRRRKRRGAADETAEQAATETAADDAARRQHEDAVQTVLHPEAEELAHSAER